MSYEAPTLRNRLTQRIALAGSLAAITLGASACGESYADKEAKSIQGAKNTEADLRKDLLSGSDVKILPGVVVIGNNVRQRSLPTRHSGIGVGTERGSDFRVIERPIIVEHKDEVAPSSDSSDNPSRYLVGFGTDRFGLDKTMVYVGVAETTEKDIELFTTDRAASDIHVCANSDQGLQDVSVDSDGITRAAFTPDYENIAIGKMLPAAEGVDVTAILNQRGYESRGPIC